VRVLVQHRVFPKERTQLLELTVLVTFRLLHRQVASPPSEHGTAELLAA
jgi:hypothetical protein